MTELQVCMEFMQSDLRMRKCMELCGLQGSLPETITEEFYDFTRNAFHQEGLLRINWEIWEPRDLFWLEMEKDSSDNKNEKNKETCWGKYNYHFVNNAICFEHNRLLHFNTKLNKNLESLLRLTLLTRNKINNLCYMCQLSVICHKQNKLLHFNKKPNRRIIYSVLYQP